MRPSIPLATSRVSPAPTPVAQNESIYAFLCRTSLVRPDWRNEIEHFAGSVFRTTFPPNGDKLAERLGTSPDWLQRAFGNDLSSGHVRVQVLERHLRYCPECMRQGYHSAVFQHCAVAKCPAHDVVLRARCPSCNQPISPSFLVIENSPYECPACHIDLRRQRVCKSNGPNLSHVDDILEGIRQSLRKGYYPGAIVHGPLPERSSFAPRPISAGQSRYWQRALVFPEVRATWLPQFREIEMPIPATPRPPPESFTRQAAAMNFIKWLRPNSGCTDQLNYLISRLGKSPGGMVLPAGASLIAMILYKFLCHYGMVRAFTNRRNTVDEFEVSSLRFGPRITRYRELDQRLMELEMLGALAVELAHYSKKRLVDPQMWWQRPEALVFAPSAIVNEEIGRVRIRYRVDEAAVLRLLRRLQDRPFLTTASTAVPSRPGHGVDDGAETIGDAQRKRLMAIDRG